MARRRRRGVEFRGYECVRERVGKARYPLWLKEGAGSRVARIQSGSQGQGHDMALYGARFEVYLSWFLRVFVCVCVCACVYVLL
jgi:hypothetical protein